MKNKSLKRISKGHYIYKGYQIDCIGYYPPERSVVWEATDEYGCGFAHATTLKEVIKNIDYDEKC